MIIMNIAEMITGDDIMNIAEMITDDNYEYS